MKYTNSELIEMEKLHVKWRNNEDGGVRADFSGQDLTNVDFTATAVPPAVTVLSGNNQTGVVG